MERAVKGDVIVLPFPFSDLTKAKKRPALIIAGAGGRDLILCQITSQPIRDQYAIPLDDIHFVTGTLKRKSNIRPNRIFTADQQIILYKIAHLKPQKIHEVTEKIIYILKK